MFLEEIYLNLSAVFLSARCQEEIPAMEKTAPDTAKKTSTAGVSKECLETDLNKDMDDSDCKYTKDRW